MSIIYFDTIPSTNLYLKENYNNLESMTAVVAKHQTFGHGRLGRSWEDSDDILMSILLKDNYGDNIESLGLLICASIYKVLKEYVENVKIKWPNDILVNNKKICGILLESVVSDKIECLVLGFGININHQKFTDELKDRATSLLLENKKEYDVKEIALKIYNMFYLDYQKYLNGDKEYLKVCKDNSCLLKKKINFYENEILREATVVDILDNGHILLDVENKLIEKRSGEITLHKSFYNKQSD